MSVLTIPNVFVNGTTINAAPFNSNFNAVATAVNSIDNSNIGTAGLFASQLIPTTLGQATFGGTIGYQFLAATSGTVPLTISGVAGQSVDIFDITLTSGGTKALAVTSAGGVSLDGAFTNQVGDLGVSRPSGVGGNPAGVLYFTPTIGKSLDYNATNANAFTFTGGNIVAPALQNGTYNSFAPPLLSFLGAAVASTARILTGQVVCTFTASQSSAAASVVFSGNAVPSSSAFVVLLTLSGASGVTGFPFMPIVGSKTTGGFTVQAFQSVSVTGTHTYDIAVFEA